MRVLDWCMLGVSILLLVCQVIIHQLCECLIVLVDGFHTLFILVRMAFPLCESVSVRGPPLSEDSPEPSSPSAAPASPQPGTLTSTSGPLDEDQHPLPPLEESAHVISSEVSPPAERCGLSYSSSRTQAVGALISALVLTSLCLSCITEIVSFSLDPHPVQRPLLPVLVGALSLLYKMLLLWLNWDQMQDEEAGPGREAESNHQVNQNVRALRGAEGWADPEKVQYAVEDSLHNGAHVLSNPGTAPVPDTNCKTPKPQPGVHLKAADPQDRNCVTDLSHSGGTLGISKDDSCMGHIDNQNTPESFQVCEPSHPTDTPLPTSGRPDWLLPSVLIAQGLFAPILVVINSLVTLLIHPQCLYGSGACNPLVYLDPGLSMLAVVTLIATAMPQVHRYGLLLMQATPPHICVSDLGRRIAGVPGVQAVHDLHVWQLTGSLTVASVHVHCHAGFPLHRCADVLSGVTKVLQSFGVSCCTVQPEFISYPGPSAGSEGDPSTVIHREDPTLPLLLPACSLSCGKACAGHMCCSLIEESRSLLTPSGETKEEPQTLVIENTFL